MKKVKIMTVIALSAVVFVSCYPMRPFRTYNEILEITANGALQSAKERAEFDIECSEVKAQQLGDVTTYPNSAIVDFTVGVSGCGKKATYFVRCTNKNIIEGEKTPCTPQLNSSSAPQSEESAVE